MSQVDDAIAAVLAASQPKGCWAASLEGDAAEFVRRLKEAKESGQGVSISVALDLLRDGWDVVISEKSLRSHLAGRCRCDR